VGTISIHWAVSECRIILQQHHHQWQRRKAAYGKIRRGAGKLHHLDFHFAAADYQVVPNTYTEITSPVSGCQAFFHRM
jgi:hypothetical protein